MNNTSNTSKTSNSDNIDSKNSNNSMCKDECFSLFILFLFAMKDRNDFILNIYSIVSILYAIFDHDDNLGIVQKYKNKLRLFNLTYALSTNEVRAITFLSPKLMVASICKSIQITKTKLHNEIVFWIRSHHRSPKNLDELQSVIIHANENIKVIRTVSIKTSKNPVVEHSVNAINVNSDLAEFKSNNVLKLPNYNTNNNTSNKNDYNNNKYNNYTNNYN